MHTHLVLNYLVGKQIFSVVGNIELVSNETIVLVAVSSLDISVGVTKCNSSMVRLSCTVFLRITHKALVDDQSNFTAGLDNGLVITKGIEAAIRINAVRTNILLIQASHYFCWSRYVGLEYIDLWIFRAFDPARRMLGNFLSALAEINFPPVVS